MAAKKNVIAVDLGAESGRVIQATFDGKEIQLEELHRFMNVPVTVRGTLHWDVLRLWRDIQTGIEKAQGPSSIGVDTWGVDFGLLDKQGNLLGNPVHYRDDRTSQMMEWVFERVPRREVYERTGIQFMALNTLYQMASLVATESPQLDCADTFLTTPDLINYWLTGNMANEFTIATTTQMFNPNKQHWDLEMLGRLGIPTDIFPDVIQPGTRLGNYNGIPVIAPACHDTGSAVVAVPATTESYAYISSGTWSLIGLEVDQPVIDDAVYAAELTNEGGAFGTIRLLRNVMGLWLAQQSRATWRKQGDEFSYPELATLASAAEQFHAFVDPDDPSFFSPGDMPARIRSFCEKTGQPVPATVGQVMRTIYESLALKYRVSLEKLIAVSGRKVDTIHIVGGGAKNELLNQMTADATGRVVVAGPTEATATGNALIQFIALGELEDIKQARDLLNRGSEMVRYEPSNTSAWQSAYETFQTIIARNQS